MSGAAASAVTTPLVEAAGVERRFRGGRGVGPVDLAVDGGEAVALMGPNGAGKTTLLRLLASLDRPRRGSVTWRGSTDRRRARDGIGLALDAVVEEETLSARQATHFWCRRWVGDAAAARRLVDAALDRLGLTEVADEPTGTYSFGMRRRLALAQALVHEPALLLLDEPTAGLDPGGASLLTAEVARRRRAGMSTVVASNDPAFVEETCDRVALFDGGALLRLASPSELLASLDTPRVAELGLGPEADLDALRGVPGVVALERTEDGARVRFRGDATLPALVAAADRPAGTLRSLQARRPDLRDCFRSLTGHDLAGVSR